MSRASTIVVGTLVVSLLAAVILLGAITL